MDFAGPGAESPPAVAEATGLVPGPGDTTSCRATKPASRRPEPTHHQDSSPGREPALRKEKPPRRSGHLLQLEKGLHAAVKARRGHERASKTNPVTKPGLPLSARRIRTSVYKSGPEATFPSTLIGAGQERAEMLSEEKEAATSSNTTCEERWSLQDSEGPPSDSSWHKPMTSISKTRTWPHASPGSQKKEQGPPLSLPVLTGGNEVQPRPAPQFRIQLHPDTGALGTKTLALGFMLYEQR